MGPAHVINGGSCIIKCIINFYTYGRGMPLGHIGPGYSHVGLMCYLCLVFVMLLRLFIAALWSPEEKGLNSWLLIVMFICDFVTFPFGVLGKVWSLIVSILDPCCLSYYDLKARLKDIINFLLHLTFLSCLLG